MTFLSLCLNYVAILTGTSYVLSINDDDPIIEPSHAHHTKNSFENANRPGLERATSCFVDRKDSHSRTSMSARCELSSPVINNISKGFTCSLNSAYNAAFIPKTYIYVLSSTTSFHTLIHMNSSLHPSLIPHHASSSFVAISVGCACQHFWA